MITPNLSLSFLNRLKPDAYGKSYSIPNPKFRGILLKSFFLILSLEGNSHPFTRCHTDNLGIVNSIIIERIDIPLPDLLYS